MKSGRKIFSKFTKISGARLNVDEDGTTREIILIIP